jgi:hypothetical protein
VPASARLTASALRIRFATSGQFFRARSHSHTRTTRQPAFRSVRVTIKSRKRIGTDADFMFEVLDMAFTKL